MSEQAVTMPELRYAIENGQIIPYFQPIVELRNGRLWGFEMLARWRHPDRGLIPPYQFIPLAEGSWLIDLMFESLVEQTFKLAATLPRHLIWSANLSASQMLDRNLPAKVRSMAERHGISTAQLTTEITETGLLQDFDRANAVAKLFKDIGTRIALDDFGTGYSSLMYVNSLPLDEIKIDQHFIMGMEAQPKSRKIASAIAGLGMSIGILSVAEGIETKENADMLHFMGCTHGQGYLFGRPSPAEEIHSMIAKERLAAPPSSAILYNGSNLAFAVDPSHSMAQLLALYDSLPVGLVFLDTNLCYVGVNRWWADRVYTDGKPRLRESIYDVIPAPALKHLEPYLRKALAGEETIDVIQDPFAPGFHKRHLEFINTHVLRHSFYPVYDEARNVIGVVMFILDITEQYSAQRAIRDHYARPLQDHGMNVFTAKPDGFIDWMGKSIIGLDLTHYLGYRWQELIHPSQRASVVAKWKETIKNAKPTSAGFYVRGGDGMWHLIYARAVPRFADTGEVIGWSGIIELLQTRKSRLHTFSFKEEIIIPVPTI